MAAIARSRASTRCCRVVSNGECLHQLSAQSDDAGWSKPVKLRTNTRALLPQQRPNLESAHPGEGERVALLIFKCDNSAFGSFQGRR